MMVAGYQKEAVWLKILCSLHPQPDFGYATGTSLQREFGMGQCGSGNGQQRSVSASVVFLL